MKFLKKASIVLVILSFIFSPFLVFAENNKEEGKTITIEELALELPTITDNPSLIITFSDPSTEKEGVHLEIDKKGFTTIKSPYSLPALSIGNHLLKFKFVDKYGATQTIDKQIIIIPRAPILNTPSVETSQIIFSGSGLAGSEVILLLSTDKKMITKVGEVDEDGKWRIEVVDSIPTGTYSFTAFVRKYGYASNLADSMTLDIGNNQKPEIKEDGRQTIHFSFKDIDNTNIKEVFSSNTDLIMLLASALVLGILFGLLFTTISHKNRENKVVEIASKTLEKPINTEEKPMTLREKLINKEVGFEKPVEEQPIEEEENVEPVVINEIKTASKSEKEPKKEEKERIVTKIDFLKDFKHEDPDDDKGKEKKKVKVSLTSKK